MRKDFAELAVDMALISSEHAHGVEILETQNLDMPIKLAAMKEFALVQERQKADSAYQVSILIRRLIPYEDLIIQLLEAEEKRLDKVADKNSDAPTPMELQGVVLKRILTGLSSRK